MPTFGDLLHFKETGQVKISLLDHREEKINKPDGVFIAKFCKSCKNWKGKSPGFEWLGECNSEDICDLYFTHQEKGKKE